MRLLPCAIRRFISNAASPQIESLIRAPVGRSERLTARHDNTPHPPSVSAGPHEDPPPHATTPPIQRNLRSPATPAALHSAHLLHTSRRKANRRATGRNLQEIHAQLAGGAPGATASIGKYLLGSTTSRAGITHRAVCSRSSREQAALRYAFFVFAHLAPHCLAPTRNFRQIALVCSCKPHTDNTARM